MKNIFLKLREKLLLKMRKIIDYSLNHGTIIFFKPYYLKNIFLWFNIRF